MINIIQHKAAIKSLNPLTENSIIYKRERWAKHFRVAKRLQCLDVYDNKRIGRKAILVEYRRYFTGKSTDVLPAFLMTMIWGYDTPGYGPFRVNKFLTANNLKIVKAGLKEMEKGETKKAFNILKQIDGLGVSFISKILYFAGRAIGNKSYPLIFDIMVARALVSLAAGGHLDNMVRVHPVNTYEAYESYNRLLHKWADELNVDAEKIEFFIFRFNAEKTVSKKV
jgi:hypothetical protein